MLLTAPYAVGVLLLLGPASPEHGREGLAHTVNTA